MAAVRPGRLVSRRRRRGAKRGLPRHAPPRPRELRYASTASAASTALSSAHSRTIA
jgi:hypothetical protein